MNLVKANLPCIFIPQLNVHFLIDTGSTRSLINPELAHKFYKRYILNENFEIQTAHNISRHNEIVKIPVFDIFGVNQIHKFYLFNISERYGGLIGTDLLEQLKASVNFASKLLITPVVKIPIIYESENLTKFKNTLQNSNYRLYIPARTNQVVKLPVNNESGTGILNYIKFERNVESPRAIVNIENYFAYTTIINSKTEPIEINITQPFTVEILNTCEVNFVEKMETDEILDETQDRIQKENLKNLRLNHCNSEEKQAIRNLCFEFRDIFYNENLPLTFTNKIQHKINLTDETPIFTKSYRYPEVHRAEVKNQIEKMLQQDIIQHSTSPWSSPLWIVPKKLDASGKRKWRVVIDYRKLNEKTIDDKYPLPNITDILDRLGRSQYFSTLDLASGFHQIQMNEADIPKTAFSTENGHYEFKRMSFGLKNSPSTFQRVMDNILRGLQSEICFVYLDDIVIFSTSLQEHISRLRSIFERLREANFKIQLDKSEFLRKEVSYLGHIITPSGVHPNPDKVSAIKDFPIPQTAKQIKSFLGLVGYYRKFIKDFAQISKPLTKCLKKNAKIEHDQNFINAFNTCKHLLINAPLLQYPDFSKPFILSTDASNIALGAVLSQGPIGSDKPVAYASRTLNDSEQRYSTIEKELLAIVWACKYFRPYLFGRKFTIYTDHRPLVWLFKLKEPNSKLIRWRLKLEEFNYDVVYRKGQTNTIADALSRIPVNVLENESILNNPGEINEDVLEYLQLSKNKQVPSTSQQVQSTQPSSNMLSNTSSIEEQNITTQHSNFHETTNAGIKISDDIINNKPYQILVFPQVYFKIDVKYETVEHAKIITAKIPEKNNERIILQFLKKHITDKKTYHIYFHTDNLYKAFCKVFLENFSERGPNLIRVTKLVNTVTDKEEQLLLVKNHHEGKANHRGINETLEYLKRNYYWHNMKVTVTEFINCCEICQRTKYARKKPYTPLMRTETASKPFQIIHIDVFRFNNKNYLTLVDAFTKLAQAIPIAGKTAINISEALIQYFTAFGVPETIIADQGTEFNNDTVKEILKLHKICIHFTTAAHHESNSIVERFHSTIIEHLRILKEIYRNEDNLMNYALIAYNSSIHSVTGFTPFELTFGHTFSRNPNEIFESNTFYTEYAENHKERLKHVYNKVKEKVQAKKDRVINKHNSQGDSSTEFCVGQTVYKKNPNCRNKKNNKFLGPYKIKSLLERNRVEIINLENQNKKEVVHIQELRKPPAFNDIPSTSKKPSSNDT